MYKIIVTFMQNIHQRQASRQWRNTTKDVTQSTSKVYTVRRHGN